MHLTNLQISEPWRQFDNINLDLKSKTTILTGENGSGKTTLLKILAYNFGIQSSFLSTPVEESETGLTKWTTGIRNFLGLATPTQNRNISIGKIDTENRASVNLILPQLSGTNYNLQMNIGGRLPGFMIGCHKPKFAYSRVNSMTFNVQSRQQAFAQYVGSANQSITGAAQSNSSNLIKQALLNWAHLGYGNNVRKTNQVAIDNFEGFKSVLQSILPDSLGFQNFEVRNNSEIVFVCLSGEFLLETASGGITSIIHLAWMIYVYSEGNPKFTVLIDEIENHLHPSLQREILPKIRETFPNVRLIVSTHSPLVVGSDEEANVYALRFNDSNRVISQKLDFKQDALSSSEILSEVLGVHSSIPIWVEEKLDKILTKHLKNGPLELDITSLKSDLEANGLSSFTSLALQSAIEKSR